MKEDHLAAKFLLWFKRLLVNGEQNKHLLQYKIFKDLNTHQRKQVADFMHSREFKAGEVLYEKGFPMEVIYFIESGEVELQPFVEGGKATVLRPHDQFGLLDLFSGRKRLGGARAVTDLKLKAITTKDFQELVTKDPGLGAKLLNASCEILGDYIRDHS